VNDPRIRLYVAGLLRAAAEVVIEPKLLPLFLGLLMKAPRTLAELLARA
jgi:hypothetical protein